MNEQFCLQNHESLNQKRPKVFVVGGQFIGEECKGNTVQFLAKQAKADIIIRSGGCNSGHNIVAEDGREQMLRHFGAATFEGTRTHLCNMVIEPSRLYNEALALKSQEVNNAFDLITIDENCLVITPFHSAISRFREILRDNKKGTIGMGVGEAIKDSSDPNLVIRAADLFLNKEELTKKIETIRQYKISQIVELTKNLNDIPSDAYKELDIIYDQSLVETMADIFLNIPQFFKIVDNSYLDKLLSEGGNIVTETSHGALLHPRYGFSPHTTQIDPTAKDLIESLESRNFSNEIIRIGAIRCFTTRHGAGPLVTYNPEITQYVQETHNNSGNDWLGEFRNGNFDFVSLKYSIGISGGKEAFGGFAVSFMDVLSKRDCWEVCEAYRYNGNASDLVDFFELNDEDQIIGIKIHPDTKKEEHYNHQLRLTELLKDCIPVLKVLKPSENKTLEQVFIDFVEEKTGIPVIILGYGPKSSDRKIRPEYDYLFSR